MGPEPSWYDVLGVAPDATTEELRAGYRHRARQLHPDVAPEAETGDAMRRLNQAWSVLGDASRRRQYDDTLALTAAARLGPAAGGPPPARAGGPARDRAEPVPDPVVAGRPHRVWFLRPSVLILVSLAGLFVVTAYAGSWPGGQGTSPPAPGSPPGTAVMPVGKCLASTGGAGLNVIVTCSGPNDGQILAEVPAVGQCPTGTVGHLWTERSTVLCVTSSSSGH